jgi:hypothetical protein
MDKCRQFLSLLPIESIYVAFAVCSPQAFSTAELLGGSISAHQYLNTQIEGFRVHIHPEVLKNPKLYQSAINLLSRKLEQSRSMLGTKIISRLQQVHFWVEWSTSRSAMMFHPSKAWLIEHGQVPEKAHGIEISNLKNFLEWAQTDQPLMTIHELAHAYLFLVLGENHLLLQSAWRNVHRKNLYKSVGYVHGGTRVAYALTNKFEYFAELSEAYFGQNDYYPFRSTELEDYDPIGFDLMEHAYSRL